MILTQKRHYNHGDINLISFFNYGIICFVINIYSDNHQIALKYLKNIKINLSNILIMIESFNIRNNNWDLLYPHYSIHADTLSKVANSFNLELSIPINQFSTRYADNPSKSNSVIDLIFVWTNSEEIDTHSILLNL